MASVAFIVLMVLISIFGASSIYWVYRDGTRVGNPRISDRRMNHIRRFVGADLLIYQQVRNRYEARNGDVRLGTFGSNPLRYIGISRVRIGSESDPLRGIQSTMHDGVELYCEGLGAGEDKGHCSGTVRTRTYATFDDAWRDLTGREPSTWTAPTPTAPPVQLLVKESVVTPVIPQTRAI